MKEITQPVNSEAIRSVPVKTRLERRINFSALMSLAKKEGNSKKPVYQMHKWWARRLGVNFRFFLLGATSDSSVREKNIWQKFYQSNNNLDLTILDPFMGGGTSIVEATKLGAKTIGIDIDPLAWFIVSKQIAHYDETKFQVDWKQVKKDLSEQIKAYYKTKVNGKLCDVIYDFWVEIIPCEKCGYEFEGNINYLIYYKNNESVPYGLGFCHVCHELHQFHESDDIIECKCGARTEVFKGNLRLGKYTCPNCHHEGHISDLPSEVLPLKKRLFAIEYIDADTGERSYKRADENDKKLYNKASKDLERFWDELPIPDQKIPTEGRTDPRPISLGYYKYNELYNRRQLLCLALILRRIIQVENRENRELLLLAFSDSLASNNLFCCYAFGYQKLTPLFGLHSFRRISRPVEGNVWGTSMGRGSFSSCVEKVIRGKLFSEKPFEFIYKNEKSHPKRIEAAATAQANIVDKVENLSCFDGRYSYLTIADSRDLSWLPKNSVDIVLTDPPYYDNLAYSEMADFYYVWLKDYVEWTVNQTSDHTPMNDSLFVRNKVEGDHQRYTEGLSKAFSGCRKSIKQDGIMIFTYHHAKPKAWESLTMALRHGDFQVTNCFPVLSEGKSGFHSDYGNLKWDIVFVCRPGIKDNLCKFHQGFAERWIKSHLTKWEIEAQSGGAKFEEADKRSLICGLMTSYLTSHKIVDEDVKTIFQHIEENIIQKQL